MASARTLRLAPLAVFALCSLRPGDPLRAEPPGGPSPPGAQPASILSRVRPDYERFIGALREIDPALPAVDGARGIYMALVRPGATDPARGESAPLIGAGARNDVLYDRAALAGGRSDAWSLLLLDHEYFHARHLAGATSLPRPGRVLPEVERHFYEAAAWGFNVSEARAGRYPGLRPDEFREALDRYGEHYAALRALTEDRDPRTWSAFSDLLRRPAVLVTTRTTPPSSGPARPSGWDRSPATP